MKLLVLLLCAVSAFASQSATGGSAWMPLPNSAPWSTIGQNDKDHRLELRLTGVSGLNGYVVAVGMYSIHTYSTDTLGLTLAHSGADAPSGEPIGSGLTGATDLLIRIQRYASTHTVTMKICITQTQVCTSGSNNLTLGNAYQAGSFSMPDGANGKLAFLRWYDNLVDEDTPITPYLTGTPEYGDWELEGNLTDDGPYALTGIWTTGTTTYSTTPIYAPACNAGAVQTLRAGGKNNTLNGASSIPLNGASTLTYFWQSLSGPSTVVWPNRTSVTPTVNGLQFGEYLFRLTVTDTDSQSSSCEVTHGAVATDANGVVVTGNSVFDTIFGPLMKHTSSPWPWMDTNNLAWADKMIGFYDTPGSMYIPEWRTPLSGTISIGVDATTITGVGTHFTTEVCVGSYYYLTVWGPARPEGGNYYTRVAIGSCDSDTQITIASSGVYCANEGWINHWGCHAAVSGVQYGRVDIALWNHQAGFINFYDNILAHYATYYRTGLTKYLTAARWLRDRWWEFRNYGLDDYGSYAGYRNTPTAGVVVGSFDTDADPNTWIWIRRMMRLSDGGPQYYYTGDVRESAYGLMAMALAALYDPDTVTARPQAKALLASSLKDSWGPHKAADGTWKTLTNSDYGIRTTSYYGDNQHDVVTVTNGSKVVTGTATNFQSSWFGTGGSNCGDGTGYCYLWTAPTSTTTGWVQPTPGTVGDTVRYRAKWISATELELDINYAGAGGGNRFWHLGAAASWMGTGIQPYMEGFAVKALLLAKQAMSGYDTDAYNVAAGATTATDWLVTNAWDAAHEDVYYGYGFGYCNPPPPTGGSCISSPNRSVFEELTSGLAQDYASRTSPPSTLKDWLDQAIGLAFGASGGPYSDGGYDTNNAYQLGVSISGWPTTAKWYGFYHGIGGVASWPAARLGGLSPAVDRTAKVGFALPSGAAKARFTSTAPSGTATPTTCTSSPCSVTLDARQGNHLIRVEYLTAGDAVIAIGEKTILTVE